MPVGRPLGAEFPESLKGPKKKIIDILSRLYADPRMKGLAAQLERILTRQAKFSDLSTIQQASKLFKATKTQNPEQIVEAFAVLQKLRQRAHAAARAAYTPASKVLRHLSLKSLIPRLGLWGAGGAALGYLINKLRKKEKRDSDIRALAEGAYGGAAAAALGSGLGALIAAGEVRAPQKLFDIKRALGKEPMKEFLKIKPGSPLGRELSNVLKEMLREDVARSQRTIDRYIKLFERARSALRRKGGWLTAIGAGALAVPTLYSLLKRRKNKEKDLASPY